MKPSKKTILIAEDDRDLLCVLERRCRQLGLDVVTVEDAVSALNAAIESRPDVICMDVELPGGNGLAASDMFLSDERFAAIPVIVITGKKDHDVQRRCHELSAYYLPKTTDTWSRLEPLLCELLGLTPIGERRPGTELVACEIGAHAMRPGAPEAPRDGSRSETPNLTEELLDVVFQLMGQNEHLHNDLFLTQRSWVLCIDDDHDFSTALACRLESHDIGVINAYDGREGFHKAFMQPASAIILDYQMPNGKGDYVLRRLKETPVTRDIPVIVLTGRKEAFIRRTMLNLGADVFLTKPVEFEQLLDEVLRRIEPLATATTTTN